MSTSCHEITTLSIRISSGYSLIFSPLCSFNDIKTLLFPLFSKLTSIPTISGLRAEPLLFRGEPMKDQMQPWLQHQLSGHLQTLQEELPWPKGCTRHLVGRSASCFKEEGWSAVLESAFLSYTIWYLVGCILSYQDETNILWCQKLELQQGYMSWQQRCSSRQWGKNKSFKL